MQTIIITNKNIYCRSHVFIRHVESMKAVKYSLYSAAAITHFLGFVCVAYLEFPRESALWPSDEDILLIRELCFTEKYAWQSQLLSNWDCDFISIYRAALVACQRTTALCIKCRSIWKHVMEIYY